MKPHIHSSLQTFLSGCERASALRHIFEYMKLSAPLAMNCDDILRSSLVLCVSSFDLFIHDILRTEIIYRLLSGSSVDYFKVPFNALLVDKSYCVEIIDSHIRQENSYKSFVAPDKLSECLRIIVADPWKKISDSLDEDVKLTKANLRMIVDLRNRIAHEADVNPAYGGIDLWPIYSRDVEWSIENIRRLGRSIAEVIDGI